MKKQILYVSTVLLCAVSTLHAQSDDPTLISITNLEQLNAIRYDLDGDGRPSSTGEADWKMVFNNPDAGIDDDDNTANPNSDTTGYELMINLNFEDANSYEAGSVNNDWVDPNGGTATEGWQPIGDETNSFVGIFEGNGYTISNLYINRELTNFVGLFGGMVSPGEMRNVGVVEGNVTGLIRAGCLLGGNLGIVENCYATGGEATAVADNNAKAGNLVGGNGGTIRDCYTTGNASTTGSVDTHAGGLVGYNSFSIIACYATGTVTGNGYAGGLVGENDGEIVACYATGTVTSQTLDAGGLVGDNNTGAIRACYATSTVTANNHAGGLVGYNKNSAGVFACYATGSSSSTSSGFGAGGLVGNNEGLIRACYATGAAIGSNYAGSLVGRNNNGIINACYATGEPETTETSGNIGGLVGNSAGGLITNSYFDVDNSPATQGVGDEPITSPPTYAKSTSEMQSPIMYDDNSDNTDGSSIYEAWNVNVDNIASIGVQDGSMPGDQEVDDPWSFGTDREYPALQVDFNGDGDPTVHEFGEQPQSAPIRIRDISPFFGPVNTEIKIAGIGFSMNVMEDSVSFDGGATYLVVDDFIDDTRTNISPSVDTLIVEVPSGAQTGTIRVKVLDGTPGESMQSFIVLVPNTLSVVNILPNFAPIGEDIKIVGASFSSTTAENEVSFDGGNNYVVADNFIDDARTGVAITIDTLVVEVPSDAQTGTIRVKVLDGTPVESTQEFEILPTIEKIEPEAAPIGEDIKIAGTSFSSTIIENRVSFDGGATYVVVDDFIEDVRTGVATTIDTLVVEVPSDAQAGTIRVRVMNGTPVESTQEFEVLPTIEDLVPEAAPPGENIKIAGTGFSSTAADNEVSFDGGNNYVVVNDFIEDVRTGVAITVDTLVVEVPSDAQAGTIRVRVMNGTPVESTQEFEILPTIEDIVPEAAPIGEDIKIAGTSFSSTTADNEVSFDGGATYVVVDDFIEDDRTGVATTIDTLVVEVPSDAQTGTIRVRVMNGTSAESAQEFEVLPTIEDIVPKVAYAGEDVKIAGTGLSSTAADNEVSFDGGNNYVVADDFIEDDRTGVAITVDTLVVEVPSDAQTGTIRVRVMNDGTPVESTQELEVLFPTIEDIVPEVAPIGEDVKIAGTGLSSTAADNEVSFDGGNNYVVADDFIEDDRTGVAITVDTLVVEVPSDAQTGTIRVKVLNSTPAESAQEFEVLPTIEDIVPEVAPVGEDIKIAGTGFSATARNDSVSFDGGATYVVANNFIDDVIDTLVVEVPSGAETGTIRVKVLNGTPAESAQEFTVEASMDDPIFSVPSLEGGLHVYPNPTSAKLHFTKLPTTDTHTYKLHSLLGQEMLSGVLRDNTIDVSSILEGQYILVLRSKGSGEVLCRTRLLIVK